MALRAIAVKPTTPQGPDQVNVLLLLFLCRVVDNPHQDLVPGFPRYLFMESKTPHQVLHRPTLTIPDLAWRHSR
jgi:hypothetical protein